MAKNLLLMATLALSLTSSLVVPSLRADESDRKTLVTTNEAINVQGTVLNPGQYVFKLLDSNAQMDVVQIYNQDERHLITSVMAIPAYRADTPDHTVLTFYESPANQPVGLRTWFYPGDNYGFEFLDMTAKQ